MFKELKEAVKNLNKSVGTDSETKLLEIAKEALPTKKWSILKGDNGYRVYNQLNTFML